jgi:uncharacterized membrane protein YcaP (DUF421 family)
MDSTWLKDMFVLTLPWLEKVVRPVIVYIFLIAGLRIAGKRELAQLNPFDLVVLLTLSNTVQNAIIGNDNSVTGGIIGAATLLVVNYLVVRFVYNHHKLEEVVEGKSDVLIFQGKVNQKALQAELITLEELEAAARKQGIASLAEIDTASIEPGGAISFIAREPAPADKRHHELLRRMDELTHEVRQLKTELNARHTPPKA